MQETSPGEAAGPSQAAGRDAGGPVWSLDGLRVGAGLALPVSPGIVGFGLAVGATIAAKGFSYFDNMLMNVVVYAGMSQLVALDMWPAHLTVDAVVALAVVTATVNARMLLMGASLYPWLGKSPAWKIYPTLHLMTDPGWLIALRYRAGGGSDAGVFLGTSLVLAAVWFAAVTAGYVLGTQIADPKRYGIDLVMPIFFAAMLVPLWHGGRRAVGWLVAGVVALLVQRLWGGWWFIVAGSLAGSLVGGLLDGKR
ncbi:MAG: AzlC family ABC transporter permease [Bauldia sp.]